MTVFIFDLDNTLFDTRTIPATLMDQLYSRLRQANADSHAVTAEVLEQALVDAWYAPFTIVSARYAFPAAFNSIWDDWQSKVSFEQPLVPFPDVIQSLRELHQQGHYLCLLTSGYRRLQWAKIEALGIASLFHEIHVDAVDESGPGKATIINDLLVTRKWNRRGMLIVGDSATSEIDAGARLGISTAQILRPGIVATDLADRHIFSLFELC